MKMLLTISLLASDRAASLERCLDSLKPLLLQLPSELIIVYTGENKQVLEIAGRYTDQIIPFEWCSDFSAARNAGLKAASGEWFLYIDDDEWFEDVTEILNFFQQGEYQKFGSACYIQRNYTDWSGTSCTDYHAFRMSRILQGTSFQSPIHEQLEPMPKPCKYFNAYVHHYGYVSTADKIHPGKTSRNIPMLLKDIEEHPDNTKNYLQLVQEYASIKNWDKAEEYCRKGRAACSGNPVYQGWLQANLATILYEKGGGKYAVQEISSMLENENPCELVRLILFNLLITLYAGENHFSEVVRYGLQFEKLLCYMEKRPELWTKQQYGTIDEQSVRNPKKLAQSRIYCTEAALEQEDIDNAEYFFRLLPWEEEKLLQYYYFDFDRWDEAYTSAFQKLLHKIAYDSPYLIYQRMKREAKEKKRLDLLKQCIDITCSVYLKQKILKQAIRMQIDLSYIIKGLTLEQWKQCIAETIRQFGSSELLKAEHAAKRIQAEYPLHYCWMKKASLEKQLTCGQFMQDQLTEIFDEYCRYIIRFYQLLYQKNMMDEKKREQLPEECQFAFLAIEALEDIKNMEYPSAVRLFRLALRQYPAMTGVINELIRQMGKHLDNPAQNAGKEYQKIAAQLKEVLSALTEQGKYAEAMSILPQLVSLLPEDLELLRIKQRLLKKMVN